MQMKKQALKEKIEEDVGALVQFLLDEKDDLLESLEAEEVATVALLDENLKLVSSEEASVDKAITDIQTQLSDSANFEVRQQHLVGWLVTVLLMMMILCIQFSFIILYLYSTFNSSIVSWRFTAKSTQEQQVLTVW